MPKYKQRTRSATVLIGRLPSIWLVWNRICKHHTINTKSKHPTFISCKFHSSWIAYACQSERIFSQHHSLSLSFSMEIPFCLRILFVVVQPPHEIDSPNVASPIIDRKSIFEQSQHIVACDQFDEPMFLGQKNWKTPPEIRWNNSRCCCTFERLGQAECRQNEHISFLNRFRKTFRWGHTASHSHIISNWALIAALSARSVCVHIILLGKKKFRLTIQMQTTTKRECENGGSCFILLWLLSAIGFVLSLSFSFSVCVCASPCAAIAKCANTF